MTLKIEPLWDSNQMSQRNLPSMPTVSLGLLILFARAATPAPANLAARSVTHSHKYLLHGDGNEWVYINYHKLGCSLELCVFSLNGHNDDFKNFKNYVPFLSKGLSYYTKDRIIITQAQEDFHFGQQSLSQPELPENCVNYFNFKHLSAFILSTNSCRDLLFSAN